jgi:hypothetical protein
MVTVFGVGERTRKAAAAAVGEGESTKRGAVFGIVGRHGVLLKLELRGRASRRKRSKAHFSTGEIMAQ